MSKQFAVVCSSMELAGMHENPDPRVRFVRKFVPFCSTSEALEKYEIYRSYRDEGQIETVCRQYAGLLS